MNLLAESGSTKTDWCEFDANQTYRSFRSTGMNPDIQQAQDIEAQLQQELQEREYDGRPQNVYFYGAGLKGEHNRIAIHHLLSKLFSEAHIQVEHDLLGAARAACLNEPGIACILGTGSNSCLFDGEFIQENVGGHGYLFGDEGGGADLGKNLIIRALEGQLPPELLSEFEAWVKMPILELRKAVYQSQRPNVYMARLSRFLVDRLDRPAVRQLVYDRFKTFFAVTVLRFPQYTELPVHFVGSIAFYYKEILLQAAHDAGLHPARFVKSPAEGLVEYHQRVNPS